MLKRAFPNSGDLQEYYPTLVHFMSDFADTARKDVKLRNISGEEYLGLKRRLLTLNHRFNNEPHLNESQQLIIMEGRSEAHPPKQSEAPSRLKRLASAATSFAGILTGSNTSSSTNAPSTAPLNLGVSDVEFLRDLPAMVIAHPILQELCEQAKNLASQYLMQSLRSRASEAALKWETSLQELYERQLLQDRDGKRIALHKKTKGELILAFNDALIGRQLQ